MSDKKSGDIGHPIQFDNINKHWYVNVSIEGTNNEIYPTFVGVGITALGANTPKSYFIRKENSRSLEDSIYKFRYVFPLVSQLQDHQLKVIFYRKQVIHLVLLIQRLQLHH